MLKKILTLLSVIGVASYLGYKFFNTKKKPEGSDIPPDNSENDASIFRKIVNYLKTILKPDIIEIISVETYDLEYITKWFKNKVAGNPHYIKRNIKPFVIKMSELLKESPIHDLEKYKNCYLQGFFDTEKNECIDFCYVEPKNISNNIVDIFGDKPMIILK